MVISIASGMQPALKWLQNDLAQAFSGAKKTAKIAHCTAGKGLAGASVLSHRTGSSSDGPAPWHIQSRPIQYSESKTIEFAATLSPVSNASRGFSSQLVPVHTGDLPYTDTCIQHVSRLIQSTSQLLLLPT